MKRVHKFVSSSFNEGFPLVRHIKAIHENIGLLIQCDQCDYKAKYKADVVNHFKSKHEGLKFPSDQCDFQAGTRQFLSEHFKSIHEDIKFPCDQCNYIANHISAKLHIILIK